MMEMLMLSLAAPLVLAIISAFFAAFITISDSIVNNYGECTININDNKKSLVVNGGSNMLITLSNQEIYIPSACGGRGSCGECKVKVRSDIGPILPTELPYLTDEQRKENVRLSCQNKVRSDVDIEIPEYLFNCRRYNRALIEEINDVTHDIKEMHIRLPDGEELNFDSGQYVQLISQPYKKVKESVQRAYSVASKPSEKNNVELLVRLVPDGILTTYVHDHLDEKDHIDLIGPFGDFYVRDTNAAMICVAGGSGMAPFKSIFKHMIETGEINDRDVWYFFGAVKARDMYYIDWLRELEKKYERFHFIPALSDPDPGDKWDGETGLITEVLDSYLKTKIKSANTKDREGYLCGSPGMLDACIEVMKSNDMSEEHIFFDKFA